MHNLTGYRYTNKYGIHYIVLKHLLLVYDNNGVSSIRLTNMISHIKFRILAFIQQFHS